MNPMTPLSFIDHIIRRLRLKNHLHWNFLRRCERLLFSTIVGKQLSKAVEELSSPSFAKQDFPLQSIVLEFLPKCLTTSLYEISS
uniref:Uncharacterized protein n=1 Tax=Nelumbo nucifera TaxID=4432 RepID=A0A822Z7V6_NELNU|nr:TPA_asm: hypothetical protein HUJ06_013868 [Nelumbo nucifera]